MKFFLKVLFYGTLLSCGRNIHHSNNAKDQSVSDKVKEVLYHDTVQYDFNNSTLAFTVTLIDSIPYRHLLVFNGDKIDFADQQSFTLLKKGKLKMLSYFSFDSLRCEYQIQGDTLEFSFLDSHPFTEQSTFILVKRSSLQNSPKK